MERKVAIITDSACDLTPAQIAENHIYMVPLRMSVGGREYRDRVDIDADAVYDMMETTLPKTSLPAAEDVRAAYDLAMEAVRFFDQGNEALAKALEKMGK